MIEVPKGIIQFIEKILQHVTSGLQKFMSIVGRLVKFESDQIKTENNQHSMMWKVAKIIKIS